MDERMDGWINGRMDRWMDGRTDGRLYVSPTRFVKNYFKRNTSTSGPDSSLGWISFEHGRLATQPTAFYKIRNGLVNIFISLCVTISLCLN